jgi:hypothetical protein
MKDSTLSFLIKEVANNKCYIKIEPYIPQEASAISIWKGENCIASVGCVFGNEEQIFLEILVQFIKKIENDKL